MLISGLLVCIFCYKIVSKIICDRLRHILPCHIAANQSGFVSGRAITDNFLLAKELYMDIDRPVHGHNIYDRIRYGQSL